MTDDQDFYSSRFARWSARQLLALDEGLPLLQEEAIQLLVESVNQGEITSIDGIDSPLSNSIKAHHGQRNFEMNSNWIASSQAWVCPCCRRSKYFIARIGKKSQILAKLVIHHDHMSEALEEAFQRAFVRAGTTDPQIEGRKLVERIAGAFAAYPEVLVCEDCNNADTEAKKLTGAPTHFSFSIGQISLFIDIGEHRPHHVEKGSATKAWLEAKAAYELRMKLIDSVAEAAATDQHWYEPFDAAKQPIPIFGHSIRIGDPVISRWVSFDALKYALGPKKCNAARNLTRWRTTTSSLGRRPPSNFLAMLRSEPAFAGCWDSVSEDWACPICRREKAEIVYMAGSGKVTFIVRSNAGRGNWLNAKTICTHCSVTLMRLKLEVASQLEHPLIDSYNFISPQELSEIIEPRPHSPHGIVKVRAAALVGTCTSRLRNTAS